MNKIVIIDGNAILHRAFHALPPLTTKDGDPINAVYGLVSMLLRIIEDIKPTYIAVAFDRSEPTFRQKAFVEYQAQRPKMDDGLSSQFPKAKEFLTTAGIPIFEKAGFEADDVIGTLAKITTVPQMTNAKSQMINEVIVVTGDRDILQLVNDRVRVYMPVVGLSAPRMMGPAEVKEKMGVIPTLIPDLKGLVGDPSDNYKGVNGIGPKTAVALLDKYGSVDGVFENLNNIADKTKDKLIKGKESAIMSHKLATIVTDVPLDFELEKCGKWKLNSDGVLHLFAEFGFRTLTERIKKLGQKIDAEKQLSLL